MQVKFSKFEKVAGIFTLLAAGAVVMSFITVAVTKGWLESDIPLETILTSGDGVYPGTEVRMSGLKIGSVTDVSFTKSNEILVHFEVAEKFLDRIKKDSRVRAFRPFIIGDKVLELSVGEQENVTPNERLLSVKHLDLVDLFSSQQIGPYLETLGGLVDNMKILLEAFSDRRRSHALIGVFDRLEPLVENMYLMSKEVHKLGRSVNRSDNIGHLVENFSIASGSMNEILPGMVQMIKENPQISGQISGLITNMSSLTESMTLLLPALAEVAPELPKASRRAIEAIDEAVVVLKAMQKSFLLRSASEDVRKEEEMKTLELNKEEVERELATQKESKKANKKKFFDPFAK
ncbi:MAG: multidrug ABC transporter substrate-binding protein [Bdellovibrionales bacterium CG10_big_fil_rev_8_21_14_0_10_45_34]|nr:MAG: multidrug ABC transporter substrate-binding protein [Bdellovibrionales bacterium CG10_big_fil_rev_8_21_14_0_10_45_34]